MIRAIKENIRRTFLYDIVRHIRQELAVQDWEKKGKPIPPPHLVKQRTVKEYAKRFRIHTFVETGTYLGDMVYAAKDTFSRIFSIELDKALHEQARNRFSRFDHISVMHGDSGEVLRDILASITQPCLFWLDAHYSGGITAKGDLETPIIQELQHILDHPIEQHVVLIDDARCLTGRNDYPTTEKLRELVFKRHSDWVFEVKNDIIRIHKRG